MARTVTTSQRVTRDTGKGKPKIDHDKLKGSLVSDRSSLADWGRRHGYHRSQVSRAVHGHRTDRRSREILAALEKEINR